MIEIHEALAPWTNFYLATATAAGALTGLQFIVQTLLASTAHRGVTSSDPEAGTAAFGTPTIVHFTIVLVLSALLCVPWPTYGGLRSALVILGVGALGYSVIVMRRMRRPFGYEATTYDLFWHVALPVVAYTSLTIAAIALGASTNVPLFAIGAATLLLLCLGIHNAWDTVTYMTAQVIRAGAPPSGSPERAPAVKTLVEPKGSAVAATPHQTRRRRRRRR